MHKGRLELTTLTLFLRFKQNTMNVAHDNKLYQRTLSSMVVAGQDQRMDTTVL